MEKIRVGAVSYLNTKPLLYGIKQHPVSEELILTEDYPSRVAQQLIDDKVDLALIPVAVIPKLKEWHIVTDYCIGSDGPVASVCLFSEVPVWEIQKVYLDYQSRTSVLLTKILLKEYWKVEVAFIDATGEDFRSKIKGTTAGLVIGDRAFEQRLVSPYIYDLGEAWKQHTGLPFVFAAWVANKDLPYGFLKKFNEANALGLKNIEQVVAQLQYKTFDLAAYFKRCISYDLTEEKTEGLNLFLKKVSI